MAQRAPAQRFALQIHRMLMRAFPPEFREVYGQDLEATFRDQLRNRSDDRRLERLAFWMTTARDLLGEGLRERLARWTGRSPPPRPRRPLRDPSPGSLAALLESTALELRLAGRSLLRRPGYAAAVVLILATGLGGATVAWTTVNDVLLKPLGFADEDRLVGV